MAYLIKRLDGRPKLAAAVMDVDIDVDQLKSLPNSAFAWEEKRAFPVHTAGHTLISCVYREGVANVPKHVDKALKEACDIYDIDTSLLTRQKVAAAPISPDDFLLPDIKKLRVTNAEQVKTAQEKLRSESFKLSAVSKATASARLMEKAASYGVQVHPDIKKMAGLTVTDTRELSRWLGARYEAAPLMHKESFQKLADTVNRLPAELRDRQQQMKLADAIQELDSLAGLQSYYNKRLPDPLMTVFNSTKIAGPGITLAGKFIPHERLASYPSSFYSDALGPDIIREASDNSGNMDTTRLAQILETLPLDMQRVLASQIH